MPRVEVLRLPASSRATPGVARGRALSSLALVVLVAALAVAGAWVSAGEGGWSRLLALELIAGIGLALLFLVAGVLGSHRRRLVVEQAPASVRLPGSRVMWGLVLGLLALCVVLPVTVLAAWLATGTLEGSAFAAIAAVLLLPLALPIWVQILRGRIRLPALELDAQGVHHHSFNASTTVSWDQLAGVRLVADPGRRLALATTGEPTRRTRSATLGEQTVGRAPGRQDEVSVPLAFMASDAALVADLLEELRARPGRRGELATGELVERLRAAGRTARSDRPV